MIAATSFSAEHQAGTGSCGGVTLWAGEHKTSPLLIKLAEQFKICLIYNLFIITIFFRIPVRDAQFQFQSGDESILINRVIHPPDHPVRRINGWLEA